MIFHVVKYRELDKTMSSLEMQLAAARAAKNKHKEEYPIFSSSEGEQIKDERKIFFVMGIITAFSGRKRRDSIRKTWMLQGSLPSSELKYLSFS